jgi:predicted RNase H-like nuclease (RuvC/YqgF family)
MSSDTSLLEIADELYGLPQEDFTPARDAKAKELKAEKELAAAVKRLKKPSVAAWVVNLFVRRDTEQVEQVIAVGQALREAQEGMDGAELRALTKQRRQLTSAVTQQARSLAKDDGVKVTQAVADQVEATLTAAMLDPECAKAVRSGLLTAALAATGVDAVDVAAAVAVPEALGFAATPTSGEPAPPPELHVVPGDAKARKREEAETALAAAQEKVDETESELAEANQSVEELQARTLQLQAEIDELRRKLSELETAAEETDEELEGAEEAQGEAEAAHSAAVKTRDAAQKKLAKLG